MFPESFQFTSNGFSVSFLLSNRDPVNGPNLNNKYMLV